MIGSVSSGFRRRRPRNANRAAVAATASPAGSRQPPADRAEVRTIPARCEPNVRPPDRRPSIAWPPMVTRSVGRTRCNFTLASGVAVASFAARVSASTSAGLAGVTDSGPAGSDVTGELLASPAVTAAAAPTVAAGAASTVCEAELAAASAAGAVWGTGAVASGSRAPTAPTAGAGAGAGAGTAGAVTAETAGSAAGDGRGARRGGSKASGSTYPCGSLVVRAPK
jgi:hypothetical protein